jgi:hypothetical protein
MVFVAGNRLQLAASLFPRLSPSSLLRVILCMQNFLVHAREPEGESLGMGGFDHVQTLMTRSVTSQKE